MGGLRVVSGDLSQGASGGLTKTGQLFNATSTCQPPTQFVAGTDIDKLMYDLAMQRKPVDTMAKRLAKAKPKGARFARKRPAAATDVAIPR